MRTIALAALLSGLLAACAVPRRDLPPPAAIELQASPETARIAALEDGRDDGEGSLLGLFEHSDPATRERVALALARFLFPEHGSEITHALEIRAASDTDLAVRMAALFALGQRADGSAGERLSEILAAGGEPGIRARAVEALSKLPRPDLRTLVLDALADSDARVRLEAAQGAQRWPRDEPSAGDVDLRLAAHLRTETDRDVIVYALSSLERRKAAPARESFLRFSASPENEVRLFAVRGLKALSPDSGLTEELVRAAADRDWRTACEAVLGLGADGSPVAVRALAEATRHPTAHVRRCAWEALASCAERDETLKAARELHSQLQGVWLDRRRFELEPSLSVRAAFLELELPLLCKLRRLDTGWSEDQSNEMVAKLGEVSAESDPVVLAGLARALAHVQEPFAQPMLGSLAAHRDPFVATAAIEALGSHPGDWTRELLLALLENRDNGLRLAALAALSEMARPTDLPALERLYETTRGEIGAEVRFNALRLARTLTPDRPSPLAEKALADPEPFVRRAAREQFLVLGLEPPSGAPLPASHAARVPLPGEDYPLYERNPRVEIVTSRGSMVVELFPAEAPLHVHSLLELADRGAYDGLDFHRVVPDFVVQGGDPRGDGNGGASWRGDSLRQEIGPRKYVRGSLGMPRWDDPDSGGGQIFLSHRRTPHLDGRYTLFGELVAGGEVLDALEVGDRIVALRRF